MEIESIRPARYWRMRAEEFHTKADQCEHERVRQSLRKAAKSYEDLARRAETIRTVQDLAE